MTGTGGLVIREMVVPDDVESVMALYRESAKWHAQSWPDRFTAQPGSDNRQELADQLANWQTDGFILVADADGAVVGVVSAELIDGLGGVSEVDGPAVWVGDVVVTATARRNGVGELLMLAVEEWARQRGARHIGLQVYVRNGPARSLYGKLGYVDDHIRMRRDL